VDSSPQAFGSALEAEIAKLRTSADGDPILFINAWNEWAEGNHLEPCRRWGLKHLEVIRKALGMNDRVSDILPIAIDIQQERDAEATPRLPDQT
jgi:hypothetical protein